MCGITLPIYTARIRDLISNLSNDYKKRSLFACDQIWASAGVGEVRKKNKTIKSTIQADDYKCELSYIKKRLGKHKRKEFIYCAFA